MRWRWQGMRSELNWGYNAIHKCVVKHILWLFCLFSLCHNTSTFPQKWQIHTQCKGCVLRSSMLQNWGWKTFAHPGECLKMFAHKVNNISSSFPLFTAAGDVSTEKPNRTILQLWTKLNQTTLSYFSAQVNRAAHIFKWWVASALFCIRRYFHSVRCTTLQHLTQASTKTMRVANLFCSVLHKTIPSCNPHTTFGKQCRDLFANLISLLSTTRWTMKTML